VATVIGYWSKNQK